MMKLTRAQHDGLIRIRDKGPMAWSSGVRGRSGGAISRMFDRMAELGLCTRAPHQITEAGRQALAEPKDPRP